MKGTRAKTCLLTGCGVMWILIVSAGAARMIHYETTPGPAAKSSPTLEVSLPLEAGRANLIMFLHPKCPCSSASLEELSRAMAQCGDRLSATVVFYCPKSMPDDWAKTRLWESASRIPHLHTIIDSDGLLAKKWGAQTSGQAFLFRPDGRIVFTGGITGSRGHEGDNAGLNAVVALTNQPSVLPWETLIRTPVYGCEILPASEIPSQGATRP
jgi:hypothetical protein